MLKTTASATDFQQVAKNLFTKTIDGELISIELNPIQNDYIITHPLTSLALVQSFKTTRTLAQKLLRKATKNQLTQEQ